jgi:cytochrome c-type biogenesis protein CcmF
VVPEIGQLSLILALLLAGVQGTLPIAGAARNRRDWMALAGPLTHGQGACVAFAFACLAWSFLRNDFSVANVAANSSSLLPAHYRLAASWGSHEGSLLLWVLMLALWSVAVARFSRRLPPETAARVLGVMGLLSAGFLLFLLLTSNPFRRLLPAPPEGRDLNPLLQDAGMVFHPPMLYMGYVGFSVAFAFAVAALLGGRLDAAWARWSRPWTTAAWCFLPLGIALGSRWAYYELGWGGWWFWDPVENASFMPWLAGTALIHSLAVTEKRAGFKSWTVLLAIGTFSLSLLGAFLVRSGVLTSVHTFATDPRRGLFMLGFFALVTGGALVLFAWRSPRIGLGAGFEPVSRESLLLANNLLLMAAAGTVLLGTLYPLALDALGLGKISVGPPYFDSVLLPILAPLVFLMAIGPLARWRAEHLPGLAWRLRWALGASVLAAAGAVLATGEWRALAGCGLFLAFWVIAASALGLRERMRAGLAAQPRAYYGMLVAHCGVAAFVAGVTLVCAYGGDHDASLTPGAAAALGGYAFRFEGVQEIAGPNYRGVRARVEVLKEGRAVATLHPEKRRYHLQETTMSEAAIHTRPHGDLYVTLGEPVSGAAWTLHLHVRPFVTWIWGGCLLMAIGGALALSDRRYRVGAHRAPAVSALNLAVLRHQLTEARAERSAGLLSEEGFRQAEAELQHEALATAAAGAPPISARHGGRRAALVAGAALPVLAAALYLGIGTPEALAPPRASVEPPVTRAQIEALAARLAARLERQPQDAQGWRVLALSYYGIGDFAGAARAYARLADLTPGDAGVLADRADALAMAQGRSMAGEPLALAHRALELDPRQWKALALLASEAFERRDYAAAIGHWEALLAAVPPEAPIAKAAAGHIARAKELAAGAARR